MTLRRLLPALMFITTALFPAAVGAQVRGRVTDGESGAAVNGALVWLSGSTIHMARSDTAGGYSFTDAPAGSYCLRVDAPGYDAAAVCISVSAGARMVVDLPLDVRPLAMAPLVVSGQRGGALLHGGRALDTTVVTRARQELSMTAARSSALAAAQLSDLTHVPDADRSDGGRPHALHIWGSSAGRGRVLLDGASLSAPLHLGALLPPMDPSIIARAAVHSGGISPRYDGGTSYIMDFTTRAPSREAGAWGEVDMIAGSVGAEAPINGRGRVLLSARRVNDEVIDGLVSSRFGYGYADALARAVVDLGGDHVLNVTGVMTGERVSIPRDFAEDRASWQNHAATVAWQRERDSNTHSATLSASRGIADLPLLSAVGGHLEAGLDRYAALAQRRWRAGELLWNAGTELEHLVFRRTSRATQDPVTGESGHVSCTAALPCSHSRATLASTFAELTLNATTGVQASVGARAMYDVDAGRVHLLPRATVTVLPGRSYAVTLAAGRFSQAYVRETTLGTGDANVDLPIDVDVAHATHLELGLARHAGRSHIRAGAYLRRHSRVEPMLRPHTVPGADVAIEYATAALTFTGAYSISGSTDTDRDSAGTAAVQHLATAGVTGRRGPWHLDVNASYGSGLPLTSIVLEQPIDAEIVLQPGSVPDAPPSDRSFLRVDASVGVRWRLGQSNAVTLMPYARIINALGQRESLFYFHDADSAAPPRGLATLPAVPVIGIRWQF